MPLLFDMPLDKLHSYQGTNPKPADFDAYWHLDGRDARSGSQSELVPAHFKTSFADCFTGSLPVWAGHESMPSCCNPRKQQKPSHSDVSWLFGKFG